jgi:hypothetical protein
VSTYSWVLHDLSGDDMRATEGFESKEEAETWMGQQWSGLVDEGAESVSLMKDDKMLYRMGLRPE